MSAKAARPRAARGRAGGRLPGRGSGGGGAESHMDNDGPDSQTVKLSSLFEPVSDV